MLHVVCTGYCLWLFSLIGRCSSKTVLTFKKLTIVIFLLGGIVKKSMPISLRSKQSTMIQASFTMLRLLSPRVILSRSVHRY